MSDTLISRMEPIPRGTVIELHVTSVYEVTLNDDLLIDGEQVATLDQIDAFFGKYTSDVIQEVGRNYDAVSDDADWFLRNALPGDYRTFRFARKTEATFANPERFVSLHDVLPKEVTK